jgi:methionyl-tRNA synthetase
MSTKYLVTPALPYANGPAHLGHLVEHIQVNIFVRALRMAGEDVLYVCGADTHGTPIELNAMKAGVKPEDFVAQWQKSHEASFKTFGIEFDGGFGTTHTPDNERHAAIIYNALKDAGKTSRKNVEQYFDPEANRFLPDRFVGGTCPFCKTPDQYGDVCESCHKTYAPTDLIEPKSKITGATPVRKSSEHIFVTLGAFKDDLVAWTSREQSVSAPVRNFLKAWLDDLKDWDISRDGPYFGFPIPDEDNKFFYVWLDAPIGYISLSEQAAKARGRSLEDYWKDPETKIFHFIGKDIVYFHTLFWPAMLKAAGYNTPEKVAVHGWLTVDGEKMSKSKGTFVKADLWAEELGDVGINGLRYYLATKLDDGIDDIDLNLEDFVERVNADLVKNSVNLVSRAANLIGRHYDGKPSAMDPAAEAMITEVKQKAATLEGLYRDLNFAQVARTVAAIGNLANKYLQDEKPWELGKDDPEKAQQVLTTALWVGKVCLGALTPIIPEVSAKLATLLGINGFTFDNLVADLEPGKAIGAYEHLFQRLELKKIKAMIDKGAEGGPDANAKGGAKGADKVGKKAKKDNKPNKGGVPEPPAEIDIDAFFQIELRAAKVTACEEVEGSDKLLQCTVDLGAKGTRTIFAGLKPHVAPADLVGHNVVVVANLAPRKMRFGTSEGMILAAGDDKPSPVFCDGAQPGDRVR